MPNGERSVGHWLTKHCGLGRFRYQTLSVHIRYTLLFTYSTFPAYFAAYSVTTQAPSSGCFNYSSARCGISWHPL